MDRVTPSRAVIGVLFGFAVFEASGCGTSGDRTSPFGSESGGAGGAGGGLLFGASGRTGQDAATCAAQVKKGELLPLDMYVLLDKSASMNEKTASGPTKWVAISTALESFVQDQGSAGLGVGIQYFPLLKPGVPATCTSHAQCGAAGPCLLSACDNQSTILPCETSADCGRGNCVPLGECERYPVGGSIGYCSPIGGQCPPPYGNCLDIPNRPCVNGIDCSISRYATPDVPIVALPAGAPQLVQSIKGAAPAGNTPTGPALEGAITHAHDWALTHPTHSVVAVLATDGLPTECTPLDIGQVAALATAGASGTPKIPTFVIGVFGPDDPASSANLQTIAQAGGTNHAFIIDTSGDVTGDFLKALDAIRGSSLLACELEIPPGEPGAPLDLDRVNLALTDKSEKSTQLIYVANQAACASHAGVGWYYDVDPSTGATPTKITLCPDVCGAFRGVVGSSLSLQIGCKTIIR